MRMLNGLMMGLALAAAVIAAGCEVNVASDRKTDSHNSVDDHSVNTGDSALESGEQPGLDTNGVPNAALLKLIDAGAWDTNSVNAGGAQ